MKRNRLESNIANTGISLEFSNNDLDKFVICFVFAKPVVHLLPLFRNFKLDSLRDVKEIAFTYKQH